MSETFELIEKTYDETTENYNVVFRYFDEESEDFDVGEVQFESEEAADEFISKHEAESVEVDIDDGPLETEDWEDEDDDDFYDGEDE